MLGRITCWTKKFLSYAGREQLIKSVLFSIQIYWSQIFVLPAKVIKLIESTCKRFLWTGGTEVTKKALLAWDKVCLPRTAGGLHILDITVWNRAAISKLLWNLCSKRDTLWVWWMHCYYIKGRPKWESNPTQKILKMKLCLQDIGWQITNL